MKIAIVTVYDSIINFGSFLQAFALSSYLESKGHEVYFVRRMSDNEIVNRFNNLALLQNKTINTNKIKNKILSFKSKIIIEREHKANNVRFSNSLKDWQKIKIINYDELEAIGIDLIICGSDEIWNKHNKDIDLNFYSCGWAGNIPKIAYAISSGDSRTSEFFEYPDFFENVGDFNKLLPRDSMTKKVIFDIVGQKEPTVCDPTILLGKKGFTITDTGKSLGKYILVYAYYLTKKEKKYIKKYAMKHGLKIISACIYSSIADEVLYTSALEFPSLVYNAECVYSTTFHGTIFSLMYAKRFTCLPRLPKVLNILEMTDCLNYAIDYNCTFDRFCFSLDKKLDREKLDDKLDGLREYSTRILDNTLAEVIRVGYSPLGNNFKDNKKYYYGYSNNCDGIRMNSSSGGMFYELAQVIIKDGGVVFGASYDERTREVVHRSTDEVPIEKLLRSKYVESKIDDVYLRIEENLQNGRKVLFCGTPCQAAGLYCLREQKFGENKKNLYIVDFLCEGVPSKKLFNEYLHVEEKRARKRIKDINFRSKYYGWNAHCMKINFKDGSMKVHPSFADSYMHTFIMDLVMNRPSCYKCAFRDEKLSDITIGDFWNVHKVDSNCKDNRGVSAIFCNSTKGEELIDAIKDFACIKTLDRRYVSQMEQALDTTPFLAKRNEFYKEFINNGYSSAIKIYSSYIRNKSFIGKIKLLRIWNKLEKKRKI